MQKTAQYTEQMKTKIEQLYDDPKAKGFVNHLIKAYLPTAKIQKVWDWKEGQKHTCNVCGQKLVSIGELFNATRSEGFMENFMENLKKEINGKPVKREDNPYLKVVGTDKVQGFTGEKTDTCMCHQCCQDLLNLVTNGMLCGDKNLNYQVNQMQRDRVFNHFAESPHLDKEDKEKVQEIKKRVDKTKVITTFGDLQALQDLKKKMEQNEK